MSKLRDAVRWIGEQPPIQILTSLAALVIAAAALVAIGLEVGEEEQDAAAIELPDTIEDLPELEEPTEPDNDDLVVPTFVPVSESGLERVVILSAVVDTDQLGGLGLSAGTLTPPPDSETIVYYDVSALPGDPAGNVILAGSSLRTTEAEGVLANLGGVREGDQILLELEDGTQYTYRVFGVRLLPEGGPALTPADVGCTDENCAGFGTLALIGFEESTPTILVQAQIVPG